MKTLHILVLALSTCTIFACDVPVQPKYDTLHPDGQSHVYYWDFTDCSNVHIPFLAFFVTQPAHQPGGYTLTLPKGTQLTITATNLITGQVAALPPPSYGSFDVAFSGADLAGGLIQVTVTMYACKKQSLDVEIVTESNVYYP